MSLKISYNDSDYKVVAGCRLGTMTDNEEFCMFPYFSSTFSTIVPLLRNTIFGLRSRSPRSLLQRADFGLGAHIADFQGFPVSQIPYSINADMSTFGSLLGRLSAVQGNLDALALNVKRSGEHNVQHSSYKGLADFRPNVNMYSSFAYIGTQELDYGVVTPKFFSGYGTHELELLEDGTFQTADSIDGVSYRCTTDDLLLAIGEYISDNDSIYTSGINNGYLSDVWTDNFNFTYQSDLSLSISFHTRFRLWKYTNRNPSWWSQLHADVNISISELYRTDFTPVPSGTYVISDPTVGVSIQLHTYDLTWGPAYSGASQCWYDSVGDFYTYQEISDPVMASPVTLSYTSAEGPTLNSYSWRPTKKPRRLLGDTSLLGIYHSNVSEDLHNLVPATFYSTADSLSKFIDIIQTNHVETLGELVLGASLLPSLAPLARIITAVSSGDILSAGVSFVDLMTGLDLWYQFGISPTLRSFQEFGDHFDELSTRLNNLGVLGTRTLNGKFIFQLPDDVYGFGPTTLIVRSKNRVRFDASTILTAALGAQAVGLAPTLSSFWDLIPFSFVADWFLDIGQRFEDVEDRLVMLAIPHIYSTHSLSVISDFPSELLDDLSLYPYGVPGDDLYPKFSYYRRIVSSVLPPIRESYYDFRAVSSLPDFSTAGSLAWQVLR